MRLQKDAQFKEDQRLYSEKKKLEEKSDTYPANTCVLIGESIVNGIIKRNLSNDRLGKFRKFLRVTTPCATYHLEASKIFNYSSRN